jgi:hypothetical protein
MFALSAPEFFEVPKVLKNLKPIIFTLLVKGD